MTECPLYNDPQPYDLLFPVSKESSARLDEARRQRILASERFYLVEAEKGGRDVLEIACGSGRLAIPLAENGFEVTGLDLSGPMSAFAKEKARAAGVRLRLLEADTRSFALPERFSTILVPGNSLLHLVAVEDLLQCLRNARQHLRKDGWFDVATPDVRFSPAIHTSMRLLSDFTIHGKAIARGIDGGKAPRVIANLGCRVVFCARTPTLVKPTLMSERYVA